MDCTDGPSFFLKPRYLNLSTIKKSINIASILKYLERSGEFSNNVKSLKAEKRMQMWTKNILLLYEETFYFVVDYDMLLNLAIVVVTFYQRLSFIMCSFTMCNDAIFYLMYS